MKHTITFFPVLLLMLVSSLGLVSAQSRPIVDRGADSIGELKVSLFFGTNGDVSLGGKHLKLPSDAQLTALKNLKSIKFANYRMMGEDRQHIFRSYENWANPMKNSKEILLSFQPLGKPAGDHLKLDLEFWQSHKKMMKSVATLKKGKPLFIQGPSWRGGKIIIAVELISLKEEKSSK